MSISLFIFVYIFFFPAVAISGEDSQLNDLLNKGIKGIYLFDKAVEFEVNCLHAKERKK